MLRGDGSRQATASLKILAPLGAGGFGAVYEALDERSGQRVAVKQLDDTSADSIARFKHEFRALADCHHPNLVSLKELIEQDGRWLIVMELVPGTDFLRYVQRTENDNAPPCFDEARLRTALSGIVEGLRALHGFGLVHRDLKPANVRVRPDGRAVLLDFGLATSVDPKKQSTHAMGLGTVVYMAPEQSGGQALGPQADLYALGVCLFEALTGRLPFDGDNAIRILLEKQQRVAPRASAFEAMVPDDLDELCARLLAVDPHARPSADQVLALLTHAPSTSLAPTRAIQVEEAFAGRESELALLERAFKRSEEGELRVVLVEGESGIGKSELVSEFVRRLHGQSPKLIAVRGRCYESEQVSYKAFDGCIDELARYLRRMPERELEAILPERAALLGQLFPVLRNVKAIARAAREGSSADPTARRLEAFAALSVLLGKLAEEHPLLLVLDDLQWADSESFRLLSALAEQPTPAPLLLIGTVRPREELERAVALPLEQVRGWQNTDVVSLLGLPREQTKALARRLMTSSVPESWLETIAHESHGHPLLLRELLAYTASRDFVARSAITLEAALSARIERLEPSQRELLELVALGARPYPIALFNAALARDVDEDARSLLAGKLLRQRRGHDVGCFHDRIRHAAVSLIPRTRLAALHYQIAGALETLPGSDAAEQGRHWDLAEQPERAAGAYEKAAEDALQALAFTHAAGLCERALALVSDAADGRVQRLTILRADALAAAGRSGEAATLYQRAAEREGGQKRLMLRCSAATHLMLSKEIGPGFAAARALLQELGFSLPKSPRIALLRYLWDMLRVAWYQRKPGATGRAPRADESTVLDICHTLTTVLSCVHPLASAVLTMQYVRRAQGLTSHQHTGLLLAIRAWLRALQGSMVQAAPLLAAGEKAIEGLADPDILSRFHYAAGTACAAGLDFVRARPHLELAQRIAQEQLADDPWRLTSIRYQLGATLSSLGEYKLHASELTRWIAEARERNDALASFLLIGLGQGYLRHLLRDDPEQAFLELEQVGAVFPAEPYTFAHLGQLLGAARVLLYRGGSAALDFVEAHQQAHRSAFLLRTKLGVEILHMLRTAALLTACVAASAAARTALLQRARRSADKVRRARSLVAQNYYELYKAQIAFLEGRPAEALTRARRARAGFQALRNTGEHAAWYLVGALEGGASGKQECEAVLAHLRGEGFANPLRMLGAGLPIYSLLDASLGTPARSGTPLLLGRYQVSGALGRGGFGRVVAANDVRSGRSVAIKELVARGGISLERFKQEYRALADLHHENIVQLESLFQHEGVWYIAMELLSGSDPVSYVWATGSCDLERLRRVFLGIAEGLGALHARGFVHRDVKPQNVLVTEEGRAVLLDFGLIGRIGDAEQAEGVGSEGFAAPEQLRGAAPRESADVHALGVCLLAAIEGSHRAAKVREQAGTAAPARSGALRELAAFARLMCAAEPEARPRLSELARLLAPAYVAPDLSARASLAVSGLEPPGYEPLHVGRQAELASVDRCLERARRGLSIVLVEGESGLGKSALLRAFAPRARLLGPVEIFESRCHESEQAAFKAFDGAVSQLAKLLRALPAALCESLLPKRAALLAQLFPVLGRVESIARAPRKGLPADPAARKLAALQCFTLLLRNLSARSPLIFMIDDLQWADPDSLALITTLAAQSDGLHLLFACTIRPPAELEAGVARTLASWRETGSVETIALTTLDPATSAAIAQGWLEREIDPARLAELVRESKGHPLLLRELVVHLKSHGEESLPAPTLGAALNARIDALEPEAQALLSLVALAGKPYGAHVFAHAFGGAELPREPLLALLKSGLVRRRDDRLTCDHDSIRSAVLARLSPEERATCAGSLAGALDLEEPTYAAERARLWDLAERALAARDAHAQAGDAALEGLAFAQAEQHYARALALCGDAGDEQLQRLWFSRGQALVGAGRSAEAAQAFQAAAARCDGEQKVRLRIWAAQHLIQSAQVEQGMKAAAVLLAELGVRLPASDTAAERRIAWERMRIKLRGVALRPRPCSPREALVLEALHGLSAPVRSASFLPGSALQVEYLRRALRVGDSRHAARALAYEALWRITNKPTQGQDALFQQSHALADASGDPALIAEVDLNHGIACFTLREPAAAEAYLARAHELLQSQCPGEPFLLTNTRMYLGLVWLNTDNFQEIRRRTGNWIEDARLRGDGHALTALSGYGSASFRHALDDAPELGLAELEAALDLWPEGSFAMAQTGALVTCYTMLSTLEEGPRFQRFIEASQERWRHAAYLRTPRSRGFILLARIQALFQSIEDARGATVAQALGSVREHLSAYARVGGLATPLITQSVKAWCQLVEGDQRAALETMRGAHALSRQRPMFYSLGVRYALGMLEGGAAGKELCDAVTAQLGAEGWKNPRRGLALRTLGNLRLLDTLKR